MDTEDSFELHLFCQEIVHLGLCLQFLLHPKNSLRILRQELGNLAFRVVQVTKDPSLCRAIGHAIGVFPHGHEMNATITLLNYTLSGMKGAGFIGACPDAVLATETAVLVNQDYSIFIDIGGLCRTDFHTYRLGALHASSRKVVHAKIGIGSYWALLVSPTEVYIWRHLMLVFAGYRTSLAAHAFIQINNQCVVLFHSFACLRFV